MTEPAITVPILSVATDESISAFDKQFDSFFSLDLTKKLEQQGILKNEVARRRMMLDVAAVQKAAAKNLGLRKGDVAKLLSDSFSTADVQMLRFDWRFWRCVAANGAIGATVMAIVAALGFGGAAVAAVASALGISTTFAAMLVGAASGGATAVVKKYCKNK